MEEKIVKILNEMSEYLSVAQMKKIDTTMQYAMVSQNNVKTSHQKYMN